MTTKEFARSLGILRKRITPSSAFLTDGHQRKPISAGQDLLYLVVLDFESTCWKEGKYHTQEIIEFPAVLCNTQTGEIESEFRHYVQPQEQPILSAFCKELTGITQADVENGIPLSLCIRKFSQWLNQHKQSKHINFSSTSSEEYKSAAFVTWSDWDLGTCLLYETKRKQLSRPPEMNSWIDLRATYRKFYGRKPNGLNGALQDVGITFEGREHSGLCDARNTARLAWRMVRDGCILQVTKDISAESVKSTNIPTLVKGKRVADQVIYTDNNSKSSPNKQPRLNGLHIRSIGDITHNTKGSISPCRQNSTSMNSVKKINRRSTDATKRVLRDVPTPNKVESKAQMKSVPSPNEENRSVYSMFKTPSPSQSSRLSSLMKPTSPLCRCGRRSKRRLVQSPGPNIGRFFFACGVNSSPMVRNKGCDFFQWECQPSTGSRKCRSVRDMIKNGTKPYTGVKSVQNKNSKLVRL